MMIAEGDWLMMGIIIITMMMMIKMRLCDDNLD